MTEQQPEQTADQAATSEPTPTAPAEQQQPAEQATAAPTTAETAVNTPDPATVDATAPAEQAAQPDDAQGQYLDSEGNLKVDENTVVQTAEQRGGTPLEGVTPTPGLHGNADY